jgi:hypothetical protein
LSNFVTTDANPVPTATQVQLRIVNMATTGQAYDYFVTAPNADLSTATPAVANLGNQNASPYITLAPGTYQIRAVPAGTDPTLRSTSVVLTSANLALAGGTGRTFVTAMNSSGNTPLVGFVLPDR